MNITLLGAGNMGSALASQLTRVGHTVRIVSRTPAKAQAIAAANPGAEVVLADTAMAGIDVVIVATGFGDAVPALQSLGRASIAELAEHALNTVPLTSFPSYEDMRIKSQ